MATPLMVSKPCSTNPSLAPNLRFHGRSKQCRVPQRQQLFGRRRTAASAALLAIFLAKESVFTSNIASAFEFRLTTPDQTFEEADAVVKLHARELVKVKAFIDSQSWREAQIALRESAPLLKQDLYTIIQAKPGSQRPQLRRLYSDLFNNVSKLDYAARDGDANKMQECYSNIVATLNQIFVLI